MKVLITGAAGFIGAATSEYFATNGHDVYAVDSFSDYYSVDLKNLRARNLKEKFNLEIKALDLSIHGEVKAAFKEFSPNVVIHLAAQPGVRLPISASHLYVRDNLVGFSNIALESIERGVDSFVYASSSSVYGNHASTILSENLGDVRPISFYGATKLSNEILATALSATSTTKFRGMRFFTVYGPWGRPDMAYLKLINSGLNNKTFTLFGDGSKKRDFTYIKDVVNCIYDLTAELMQKSGKYSDIVNIGGGNPVSMDSLISTIENELQTKIKIAKSSDAMGDVITTYASNEYLENLIGFRKFIEINDGIKETINWSRQYSSENQLDKWV